MSNNLTIGSITDRVLQNLNTDSFAKSVLAKENKNLRHMVSITIDDGLLSDYEILLPIMKEYGLRATHYVIGNENRHTTGNNLSVEQIREISDYGNEIGCHTSTHPDLLTLSDEEIVEEWFNSKKYLEGITNKPVYTHAYPYGHNDERVRNLASGLFEFARGTSDEGSLRAPEEFDVIAGNTRMNRVMQYGRSDVYNATPFGLDSRQPSHFKQSLDRFLTLPEPTYFIIYMHGVFRDGDPDKPENRKSESEIRECFEYIASLKNQGLLDVVPFVEGMRRLQGSRSIYL